MIYAVIVNYNSGKRLSDLLCRLREYDIRVVVVDNASTDESHRVFYMDHLIRNDKNRLYSAAANQGIDLALKKRARHILLMNYDLRLTNDFLSKLVEVDTDIAGSLIKYNSHDLIWSAGGRINFERKKIYHVGLRSDVNRKQSVDWVTFCCALIKREVFEQVGMLDYHFKFMGEDVDFCWRAKKKGFKIECVSDSVVYHDISLRRVSVQRLYHKARNNKLFFEKHGAK